MKRIKKVNQLSHRVPALIFAAIFAALGVYILAFTHAATSITISLNPASSTVGVGSNFNVTVVENSSTSQVAAVTASLSYDPAKIQFVSSDPATSAFTTEADNTGGNGSVLLTRAKTGTALTGQQTVSILTFKALAVGSATITVNGACATTTQTGCSSVVLDGATNLLTGVTSGTYTISDTSAPTTPAGLAKSNVTATAATISWTASTDNVGVTGYNIFRNGTKIATSATNSYTNTGLTPSTNYSYTVQAYDAAGNVSGQSTALAVTTTADTTSPITPTGLTTSSVTSTSITLTWTASTDNVGVTGYNIFRGGTKIATSATNSYTNTGLTPGTDYSYTVQAYDAAGNVSAQSTAASAKTVADSQPPTVPSNLTAPAKTNTSVTLNWTASTDNLGVTGYNIFRDGTKIATSATNSYTNSSLTPGTAYSYTIQAYDAAGNVSAQSTALSVTTSIKSGDINSDNAVDITDLSIMAANFNKSSATRSMGDLNNDGVVNVYDLGILCNGWGK